MIDAFAEHEVSEEIKKRLDEVREAFSTLTTLLYPNSDLPEHNSRGAAIVRTKLEEACMWAVRNIVVHNILTAAPVVD